MVKVKKSRVSGLLLALGGALVGARALKKTQEAKAQATSSETATKVENIENKQTSQVPHGKGSKSGCCCKNKKGFKIPIKYH